MVERVFSSGMTYTKAETAYLGCVYDLLQERGFHPYVDVLKKEGVDTQHRASTAVLITTILMAIDFTNNQLVLPQHVNEITIERMRKSIEVHLAGTKRRRETTKLVDSYSKTLPALNKGALKLGELVQAYQEAADEL